MDNFFALGPLTSPNLNIIGNMGYRSLGINSNKLLGVCTTYRRSVAYM